MTTASMPQPSIIAADGLVDLAEGRIIGFGVGAQDIQAMTATRIAFGGGTAAGGLRVEGWIDRTSWDARIDVHPHAGAGTLIGMRLACRAVPAVA